MQILKTVFKKKNYVIKLHKNNDDDNDNFKYACIITIFLLIKFLYILIHSLDYLFRLIQTFTIFPNLIDLVAVSSSIAYCLLNLSSKSIFSQCILYSFSKISFNF